MAFEPDDKPLVFVSWDSADREEAERAVSLLEASPVRAWISSRDIREGEDYTEVIARVIPECSAVLVLLSASALESGHVATEVELAKSENVPIVPAGLPTFPGFGSLSGRWKYLLSMANVKPGSDAASAVRRCIEVALPSPLGPVGRRARRTVSGGRTYAVIRPARPQFVGADRRAHLEQLLQIWEQVKMQRRPHLAVLLGETGFGKTRIVQEFYAALASGQPHPAFWPADIAADASGRDALRESRKRVTPATFTPPQGAAAEYLWAGYIVDEGYEGRLDLGVQVLSDEVGRGLSAAVEADSSGAAAAMVSAAMPDRVGSVGARRQEISELLRTGTGAGVDSVAPGTTEAFWQGVRALWGKSDSLPTVLVIEDGHFAGAATVAVVEQLLQGDGLPLLMLVCAQPSQLTRHSGTGELKRPLVELLGDHMPQVSVIRVDRLADRDIAAMILETLPDLDQDSLQAAVRKVDGNPYHARTLLGPMSTAAKNGTLTAGWVADRPSDFEGELKSQWRLLDDDVRRLLSGNAVLGTQIPEKLGFRALKSVDPLCDTSLEPTLESGWLRRLQSDDALRFLERSRWVIAHEESYDEWAWQDRRRIIGEALRTLEERAAGSDGIPDPLLQQLHLALARAADEAGVPFDRAAAIRSGLAGSLRLRLATDDQGAFDLARETDALVRGHDDEPIIDVLAVEVALAMYSSHVWISAGGSVNPTTRSAAELSAARVERVAERRPDLAAQAHAAVARAHRVRFDAGELSRGEVHLRRAESYLAACVWPAPAAVEQVYHAQAMFFKAKGDNRAAADVTMKRLRLLEEQFGALDRRVLRAMVNAGMYLMRVDYAASVRVRGELLGRERRVWHDSNNERAAFAEKELAFALARSQDSAEIREAFRLARHSSDVRERHFGPRDHRAVVARGVWIAVGCRLADLLEREDGSREVLLDELLAAAQFNLDATPSDAVPGTLMARRGRLGSVLVLRGETKGVDLLTSVLAERTRDDLSGERPTPNELARIDIEVLWAVGELVAAYVRFGSDQSALDLAAAFGLVRIPQLPAFQSCGWRSTRPQDANAGPF